MLTSEILDIKLEDSAGDEYTIRQYLHTIMSALWEEGECFNSKRPLGNSGWKYEIYIALVANNVVYGKVDEDGYIESINTVQADTVIAQAIDFIFTKDGTHE